MDSSVTPLKKYKNLSLVQTVDFFYPLVDDPYTIGQIAFANVVSDIYAVGVTEIDQIKLIISSCTEFNLIERDVIIKLMIKGFIDSSKLANCCITIGNDLIINPWCIIGGIATSICSRDEIIIPNKSQLGDCLILTKPLGTQLATNSYIWMTHHNDDDDGISISTNWLKIKEKLTRDDITETYKIAVNSMIGLNKIAAELMHKYKCNCSTDITGFGLYGHAKNLIEYQINKELTFLINKLPIIHNVLEISELIGQKYKLLTGYCVETSGGLLISCPNENGEKFCDDFKELTGNNCWIIGNVIKGNNSVEIVKEPEVIVVKM